MVIQVHFDIDRTSYTYEVEPRVDGLFIAKLQPPKWGGVHSYLIPQKIHLYRTPKGWKGDHNRSDIIQAIGLQIDEVMKQ